MIIQRKVQIPVSNPYIVTFSVLFWIDILIKPLKQVRLLGFDGDGLYTYNNLTNPLYQFPSDLLDAITTSQAPGVLPFFAFSNTELSMYANEQIIFSRRPMKLISSMTLEQGVQYKFRVSSIVSDITTSIGLTGTSLDINDHNTFSNFVTAIINGQCLVFLDAFIDLECDKLVTESDLTYTHIFGQLQ